MKDSQADKGNIITVENSSVKKKLAETILLTWLNLRVITEQKLK